MLTIRPARPEDAPAIADFWNPYIRDTAVTFSAQPKSAAQVAAMIAQRQKAGQCFLVAQQGARVVGFATYKGFRAPDGYAQAVESTVILAPDAQGKGIARALMQKLEDHARDAGMHTVIAAIGGENTGALKFHAAIGYRAAGVIVRAGRKFERWMDLHLMQKIL